MEALNFFKLWRLPYTAGGNLIPPPEYDDDDSFFDLNLNVPYYELNRNQLIEINGSESDNDETMSESRSPISFLRSPAKLPSFFMFRKKTSGAGNESPASTGFGRANSSKKKMQRPRDVVSRYLRLMRVGVSRSNGERSMESPSRNAVEDRQGMRSPSMRIVCRRWGKSQSSAKVSGASPMARASCEGELRSDGIQSAILHCKRSYSSKDKSVLWRSVSDPVISSGANPSRFSMEDKKRISF